MMGRKSRKAKSYVQWLQKFGDLMAKDRVGVIKASKSQLEP